MTKYALAVLACVGCLWFPAAAAAQSPNMVVYEGTAGPGRGKHIVFLAGDHEYRSEESLPALARILARHYGFKCTVFFTTDPKTGLLEPGSSNIAGLDALKTADLLVIFLRFQDFPDAEMQHVVDYLDRGGPVVGLRTATHSFQIKRPDAKFRKYDWQNGDDYKGGFGRQVLGETWVSHYGTNHKQSSRLLLEPEQSQHPILRGVHDVWAQSGGYTAHPIEGSQVLAKGQVLDGMTPDSPAAAAKPDQVPVAWYRTYTSASGKPGRVFTTTHGASEDLLNDGFRRMIVNACLWSAGLETSIKPDGDISFVGPYQPTTFGFGAYVKGVKPADLAGWDSPILPKAQK
ncbi:MAG: ThuA domain-containing protein [Acidobacteriota bacterium]